MRNINNIHACILALLVSSNITVLASSNITGNFLFSLVDNPEYTLYSKIYTEFDPIETLHFCTNNHTPLSKICKDYLSNYYLAQPVWTYSQYEHVDPSRLTIFGYSILSESALIQGFGNSAIISNDVPKWEDIFDDKILERVDLVANVLEDTNCLKVSELDVPDSSHSESCRARDLFKYAALLDVCVTAIERNNFLSSPRFFRNIIKSNYEWSIDTVLSNVQISDRRSKILNLQVNLYFNSIWVSEMCSDYPWMIIDNNLNVRKNSRLSTNETISLLHNTYDQLIRIAAKAGDEWAIMSYFPKYESSEYWDGLFKKHELLVHRFLGYGGRSIDEGLLSENESMKHALKYVSLLQDKWDNVEIEEYSFFTDQFGFYPEQELVDIWKSVRNNQVRFQYPWKSKLSTNHETGNNYTRRN